MNMQPCYEEAALIELSILGLPMVSFRPNRSTSKRRYSAEAERQPQSNKKSHVDQTLTFSTNNGAEKFIIEEVEEESKFGCGSIVATIIIALVIGLCGGFKSCKEDKKPKAVESRTEQPQRLDEVKVQSPPYVPKSSHPSVSAPTSTTASKPQKEASVEPITETSFDDDIEVEEPLCFHAPDPTR